MKFYPLLYTVLILFGGAVTLNDMINAAPAEAQFVGKGAPKRTAGGGSR